MGDNRMNSGEWGAQQKAVTPNEQTALLVGRKLQANLNM